MSDLTDDLTTAFIKDAYELHDILLPQGKPEQPYRRTMMSDLIERLEKYLDAIPDDLRHESPNDMIALLDECLAALSPVLPDDMADIKEEIETALHTCDDHIHGFDYHIYCQLHEAFTSAADLLERLYNECAALRSREDIGIDLARQQANCIEQLEAPVLPDDVAKFIESLKDPTENTPTRREAADLLERQARENAQLRDACGNNQQSIVMVRNHYEQRIEQLEEKLHWKIVSHIAADERIEQLEALIDEIDKSDCNIGTGAIIVGFRKRAALQENNDE